MTKWTLITMALSLLVGRYSRGWLRRAIARVLQPKHEQGRLGPNAN